MNWENGLLMFACALAGGLVQSVTGFGAGIMMMIFMPSFLPLLEASAVSSLVTIPMQLALIYNYRKYIRVDYLWKPLAFYLLMSAIAITVAAGQDMTGLKIGFGAFLIVLSVYFMFFSSRLKIRAGWVSAAVCGGISGASSGLFGIGGPPMVLYFLALTGNDKYVYLGTLQVFFCITSFYTTTVRVINGIFTWELIPFVLVGSAGILTGKTIGTRIVEKINTETMKKLVYLFLGFAGLVNVISNL